MLLVIGGTQGKRELSDFNSEEKILDSAHESSVSVNGETSDMKKEDVLSAHDQSETMPFSSIDLSQQENIFGIADVNVVTRTRTDHKYHYRSQALEVDRALALRKSSQIHNTRRTNHTNLVLEISHDAGCECADKSLSCDCCHETICLPELGCFWDEKAADKQCVPVANAVQDLESPFDGLWEKVLQYTISNTATRGQEHIVDNIGAEDPFKITSITTRKAGKSSMVVQEEDSYTKQTQSYTAELDSEDLNHMIWDDDGIWKRIGEVKDESAPFDGEWEFVPDDDHTPECFRVSQDHLEFQDMSLLTV